MQVYHYCFLLLGFVVIINSRYIERALDNEHDDDLNAFSNEHMRRALHRSDIERYLRALIAFDAHDDESGPFERRTKAITKGDPREFMG